MRALITGITGQDGPFLAGHLTAAGWDVTGMVRGQPRPDRDEVRRLVPGVTLAEGDLLDQPSLHRVLAETAPDVVFNLAAMTFVPLSFRQPVLTADVTGTGTGTSYRPSFRVIAVGTAANSIAPGLTV